MKYITAIKAFTINNYKNFLKGMVLGAVMTVPGLSGGTIAIILGIYVPLIGAVNNLFKNSKKSIALLAVTGFGGILGFLLFSAIIDTAITKNEMLTNYLFAGIVLGSLPLIISQAQIDKAKLATKNAIPMYIFMFIVGFAIVVGLYFCQSSIENVATGTKGMLAVLTNLVAGAFTAVALVLPGISGALFLKSIGLYHTFIAAISFTSKFDFLFLLPFGFGLIVGVFLTAKLIDGLFQKSKTYTFIAICGFLIGTVVTMLVDKLPKGGQIAFSLLAMFAGASITILIYLLTKKIAKTDKT